MGESYTCYPRKHRSKDAAPTLRRYSESISSALPRGRVVDAACPSQVAAGAPRGRPLHREVLGDLLVAIATRR